MAFIWSSNQVSSLILTIYETNLTLNQAATQYFKEVNYVLVGYDLETKEIGIKPVTKLELEQNIYPQDKLHKITIGKSYGRVSNKSFIEELSMIWNLDFSENKCYKIQMQYDAIHKILKGTYKEGD